MKFQGGKERIFFALFLFFSFPQREELALKYKNAFREEKHTAAAQAARNSNSGWNWIAHVRLSVGYIFAFFLLVLFC